MQYTTKQINPKSMQPIIDMPGNHVCLAVKVWIVGGVNGSRMRFKRASILCSPGFVFNHEVFFLRC